MAAAATAPAGTAPSLREAFPRLRQLERHDRGYVRRLEKLQLETRAFADLYLRPAALEVDRRTDEDPSWFDWDLVRAGGLHSMLDFLLPSQVGGRGCLTIGCAIVMEELCAACPGLGLIFGAHG
ncbi:MAG TPA: acyl-CoA dehydrogenase family protein, partial [Solirubrobacterales bacterium]|nr:acyl-CoA dehydrogenase family protein [Solirubrobacterales bacterium]